MRIHIFIIVVLIAASSTAAQKTVAPPPPKPAPAPAKVADLIGDVAGNTYTNTFFGFELSVPSGFTILARPELELYSNAGADAIKSKATEDIKDFDDAQLRTTTLFAAARLPLGTPGNSALEIAAVKQPSGVTASMVLLATAKVMTETGTYRLTASLPTKKIGSWTFSAMELETSAFGPVLRQTTYVTMRKGYALMITITHPDDSGLSAFDPVLESLTVLKK